MKKLVQGIVEFRQKVRPEYKEKFAQLALGQSPDALFIACSDSRVVPNLFASTEPGDLFVLRNIGNLVPCCGNQDKLAAEDSAAAAIEFALLNLNVADIVVCGHSECGAMQALLQGREAVAPPHLKSWLRHGEAALARLQQIGPGASPRSQLSPVNQLSQLNVLQQLEHLRSFPLVRERIAAGRLQLHGWWFELRTADVYAYEETSGHFVLIDEAGAARILQRISSR